MTDFLAQSPDEQLARLDIAGREALRHWDLEGAALHLIKHRENAVYRVESDDTRHALRLHRPGYHSDDALRSELEWMQALADAGITVPTSVPTISGERFIRQAVDGLPDGVQVDLFEWIEGEQLGSVEEGISDAANVTETYATIGELAARVHNQASTWQLPAGFARHAWDADGLAGEQPLWGRFWEIEAAAASERALLTRAKARVYADLGRLEQSAAVYSLIHADFAPENVMVDKNGPRLIDFDDSGFGWHLFELVTSLFFIRDEPYFDDARKALIDGYRRHRALGEKQLERMPLFFLARSFTYVGWVHSRPETETAKELTPMLVAACCELAEDYLSNPGG